MAEANIGGGDLEYLLLHLPVAVGEQLWHSILRKHRCLTYEPCESAEVQLERLAAADLPFAFAPEVHPDLAEVFARFDAAP